MENQLSINACDRRPISYHEILAYKLRGELHSIRTSQSAELTKDDTKLSGLRKMKQTEGSQHVKEGYLHTGEQFAICDEMLTRRKYAVARIRIATACRNGETEQGCWSVEGYP